MKKTVSLVLCLVLMISVLSVGAFADTKEDPCAKFTDVDTSRWYHTALDYVLTEGYMAGTSDITFEPNGNVSRAMTVQTLYAVAGKPESTDTCPFTDLTRDWYKDAVAWAYNNGVAAGMTATAFVPNADVTREQLVTFFYAFAKYQKSERVGKGTLIDNYKDADQVSKYALEAMQWAVAVELISGRTEDTLVPKGTATRAELAQMLYKYCTTIAPQEEPEEEVYAPVLELYKKALDENWDVTKCTENDVCYLIAMEKEVVDAGYLKTDLDGDGKDELIIAPIWEESDPDYYTGMVYAVYTQEDGKAVQVLSSEERDRYYLCENGDFARQGSGGATLSINQYYKMESGKLVLLEQVWYNANADADNPWFYNDKEIDSENMSDEEFKAAMKSISEKEAQEIQAKYVPKALELSPISEEQA